MMKFRIVLIAAVLQVVVAEVLQNLLTPDKPLISDSYNFSRRSLDDAEPANISPRKIEDELEYMFQENPNAVLTQSVYDYLPSLWPKIINLEAECFQTSMRVRVTFDRPYTGAIYPKNYYRNRDCLLLPWGGSEVEYEFDLNLDECGTQSRKFTEKNVVIYMTNTLVFQLDRLIRGKGDTMRDVQCWWLDRTNHTTFRGITVELEGPKTDIFKMSDVTIHMEIKSGKGPFMPDVGEVVKVGEPVTLVIYVFSAHKVDVSIHACYAHYGNRNQSIRLTDDSGCIIKKSVLGAWAFTRQTGQTGAAVLAYAYMQAFRFPDKYDLLIECDVEACEEACPSHCPDYPPLDLRYLERRKREIQEHFRSDELLLGMTTDSRYFPAYSGIVVVNHTILGTVPAEVKSRLCVSYVLIVFFLIAIIIFFMLGFVLIHYGGSSILHYDGL